MANMNQFKSSIDDYNYACSLAQDEHFWDLGVEYFRKSFKDKFARFPTPPNSNLITRIHSFNREGDDIKIKIYKDKSRQMRIGGDKCIVYGHGGGFIGGGFEVVDGICQDFVFDLGITVIAIDYRGAPEYPHPTAPLDILAGVLHVRDYAQEYGIDPNEIFIGGESSGGCFAVSIPLMLRDYKIPQVAGIISINPVLNTHRWANRQFHECSKEWQDEMYFFTNTYLACNQQILPEYASPLMTSDVSGLPPAVFFAAKSDPLCEDAKEMHSRLISAGINSHIHIDEYALHGSIRARHYYIFARNAYIALLDAVKKIME